MIILFFCFSCSDDSLKYSEIAEIEEIYPVGKFSHSEISNQSYETPIKGLTEEQKLQFRRGRRLFRTNWVPSPASTTGLDGLGPLFNAKACRSCHPNNGRGGSLVDKKSSFLMRLSLPGETITGAPIPVPNYGVQLQTKAVLRVPSEGEVSVKFEVIKGIYKDGISYEIRKPVYTITHTKYGDLPPNVLTSPRIGNQLIGLGFIEGLSDSEILKNTDEFDKDKDGISGRANYVWDVEKQKRVIGKFGWKANEPNLKQQISGAFHGDIGLSNPLFPNQNCSNMYFDCEKFTNGNGDSFEVPERGINDVVVFESSISVPMNRNFKDENVLKGKDLFRELKCISCHQTGFKVETSKVLPQINGTIINPYSDYLLHDMGEDLADNRPDFKATGKEWRTAPLWGIGLQERVNGHSVFLHDGRARNLEEAIIWHGGEALQSRNDFISLSEVERMQVLAFLKSL